LLKLRES